MKSEGYVDRDVALALSLRDNMKFKQSKRRHSRQRSSQGHSSQENDDDADDDGDDVDSRAPLQLAPRYATHTPSPLSTSHSHHTDRTIDCKQGIYFYAPKSYFSY